MRHETTVGAPPDVSAAIGLLRQKPILDEPCAQLKLVRGIATAVSDFLPRTPQVGTNCFGGKTENEGDLVGRVIVGKEFGDHRFSRGQRQR
jgi:hypothetical protein